MAESTRIPLLDLAAQHASLGRDLEDAVAGVMRHGAFVNGPEVAAFEDAFAAFCGVDHCVGLSNGTDALALGLRCAGIGPGDEVITTPFTFLATVEAIVQAGAEPVLVDPRPDTALLDAADVENAVTARTAAIVAVHLYGQPVDLRAFRSLADRRGLLLVEDAAQAHGASHDGVPAGSCGDLATFSFFPGKNLGALGDAGALTTRDPALAARVRSLRDHGRSEKYLHAELGTNARLDTLQAAVLLVKLRRLATWNDARRKHALAYDEELAGVDGVTPIHVEDGAVSVYHQYVVRVGEREAARRHLADRGISTGVHYPVPLHRQPALADRFAEAELPHADALASDVLSLPVYPELTAAQRRRVVEALREHAETGVLANTAAAS